MPSSPAMIARLSAVGLRYPTGVEALRRVYLQLKAGSFHFLVGASGAGKSSLLKLLAAAQAPSEGSLHLFGRDPHKLGRDDLSALRRRIGVVHQDHRLLDHLTAFENAALPLRIGGARDEQIAAIVSDMLNWLGLGDQLEARPAQLSMGQRQLVAVARAVVTRPGLILADEPTSNLDPERARRVMHLLVSLNELGTTVLLATHSGDLLRSHRYPLIEMAAGRLHAPPSLSLAAE